MENVFISLVKPPLTRCTGRQKKEDHMHKLVEAMADMKRRKLSDRG